PPLLLPPGHVHLPEDPRPRRAPPDLRRELFAVYRLPERDIWRNGVHLVALQPPDEVPARHGVAGVSERARFRDQVLGAVLAEIGRARVEDVANGVDTDGLGHDDQRDLTWFTAGIPRRGVDTRPNLGERLGDGHVRTATVTRRPVAPSRPCDKYAAHPAVH